MEDGAYSSLRDFDYLNSAAVTTVRMLLQSPVNDHKVIVIVEGSDDKEVYEHFFNQESSSFYPDENCERHFDILSILNPSFAHRLIAIKDADFDHLDGNEPVFDNMMVTDVHDLELMVLRNGIPQSIVDEYPDRFNDFAVEDILNDLSRVSCLKWFSSKQTARLKFKGVNLRQFYNGKTAVDVEAYYNESKSVTNNTITWSFADFESFEQQHENQDLWQLCRGHDVFECIFIRAHQADPNSNFCKKSLFKLMRNSYDIDSFKVTNLYEAISNWADIHGIQLMVA